MIQIRITTKDSVKLKEISELLIDKHLVTGINMSETLSMYKDESGEIKIISTTLFVGRTKSSLFNVIENLLFDKYGNDIPSIYGLPITNIDSIHMYKLKRVVSE